MILTTSQAIDLANELSCTQGMLIANWSEVDYIFDLRNYVYNTYGGDLHSPNGSTWHITFEDPKYETLFTIKHPPMP